MKKKILVLIGLVILTTGCNATINVNIDKENINQKYIYSNGNSVREIRAMSKDTADGIWNSLPTNTLVFCW